MTLVDTSVLVEYLRTGDARLLGLFQSLPGAVCGTIRAELLHGAKNPADRARLQTLLNAFSHAPTPESVWDAIGDLLALLRANGVSVPFNDVVIASVAVNAGIPLWTNDRQFLQIQRIEPRLRLFQPIA